MIARADRDRPTPPLSRVVRAQLGLLAGGRKRGLVIGLGLVVAQLVVLAAWGYLFGVAVDVGEEGSDVHLTHVSQLQKGLDLPLDEGASAVVGAFIFLLVFALFWPLRVWRQETPSHRGYHWAMPVARRRHDLARVGAGAVGLLAIAALLYAVAAVTALAAGHTGFQGFSPWFWLGLILGPLLSYAAGSISAVRCEHPAAWLWAFLGLLLTVWFLEAGRGVTGGATLLITGRFGLGWAMAGPVLGEVLQRLPAGPTGLLTWVVWLALFAGGVALAASTRSRST